MCIWFSGLIEIKFLSFLSFVWFGLTLKFNVLYGRRQQSMAKWTCSPVYNFSSICQMVTHYTLPRFVRIQ